MASKRLSIDGTRFRDADGREVTFRGINVSGDAKLPRRPDQPSHEPLDFFDGDNVSFLGRPFNKEEAREHFARLKSWGYNLIRYIFTWEALEHEGPGKYDEEFIEHTISLLRMAKEYGFYVFMDPHQDVWSRFSGGSGAPLWTWYACGIDPRSFSTTQAAVVHNTYPDPATFPKMIWSTNYTRLACQTIFTLFWGGKEYAPKAIIDGQNISDYLQGHYIAACKHLAKRIHEAGDLEHDCIIGWETVNEPHRGLISVQDLTAYPAQQKLHKGTSPTPWQAMLTGSGRACEIDTYDFGSFGPYKTGRELVDPEGMTMWLSKDYDDTKYGWKRDPEWKLGECIWAQHGVWDASTDTLLKKDYFGKSPQTGEVLDYEGYTNLFFMQHYRKYKEAIRSVFKDCFMLLQPPVLEIPPTIKGTDDDDPLMIFATHYYDGLTLITKHWNRLYNVDVFGVMRGKYLAPAFALKVGETAIRNCLRDQLEAIRKEGLEKMGIHPCLFTEIGIPYDMDDKKAYKTGDYGSQILAMDANHYALEGSGASGFTLWTYVGTNDHQWGDYWNGEDLSIFSHDDRQLPSEPETPSLSTTSLNPRSPSFSDSQTKLAKPIDPSNIQSSLKTPSISSRPSGTSAELRATPGYRAAEAFVRPSPLKTNGSVQKYGFDLKSCTFTLSLEAEKPTVEDQPTEIYLPEFHFPITRIKVEVSGGKWTISTDEECGAAVQRLRWWHGEGEQNIKIEGVKRKAGAYGEGSADSDDYGYLDQCRELASCSIM